MRRKWKHTSLHPERGKHESHTSKVFNAYFKAFDGDLLAVKKDAESGRGAGDVVGAAGQQRHDV